MVQKQPCLAHSEPDVCRNIPKSNDRILVSTPIVVVRIKDPTKPIMRVARREDRFFYLGDDRSRMKVWSRFGGADVLEH